MEEIKWVNAQKACANFQISDNTLARIVQEKPSFVKYDNNGTSYNLSELQQHIFGHTLVREILAKQSPTTLNFERILNP